MAESRKKVERVPVQTFEDKVVGIALDLSLEEAAMVYDVLGRVGGSSQLTRRGHSDSVRGALSKHYEDFKHTREVDGNSIPKDMSDCSSIYFQGK